MKFSDVLFWLAPLALFVVLAKLNFLPWMIVDRGEIERRDQEIVRLQAEIKETRQPSQPRAGWGETLLNKRAR